MPHTQSAKKALRQNRTRNLRNRAIKSRLRTEQNKFDRMVERGDFEAAAQQLQLLTKLYHRAAEKHILHANKAARKQAQFQKHLNDAMAGASA